MVEEKISKVEKTELKENENVKEEKVETKKESKKETKVERVSKEFAVARGVSLRISPKKSYAVCKMIKGMSCEKAIEVLELVIKGKKVVPMRGREVPHQKSRGEKGIAGGRFPKNVAQEMIKILKQAKANADVCGVENPVIVIAKADIASRPYRREGKRAKRAHVYIELRDRNKLSKKGDKK